MKKKTKRGTTKKSSRSAWREYACAALSGELASGQQMPCSQAAMMADRMLDLEHERFGSEETVCCDSD